MKRYKQSEDLVEKINRALESTESLKHGMGKNAVPHARG
jgi:hypothetical protein